MLPTVSPTHPIIYRKLRLAGACIFGTLLAACGKSPSQPGTSPGAAGQSLPLPPSAMGLVAQNQLRMVWARTSEAGKSDCFAQGKSLILMGTDTGDGLGIRTLRADPGSYFRPLFLPSGATIVYTDRSGAAPEMLAIDWGDASPPRKLGPGVALATWRDSVDLVTWIFALEETQISARGGLVGNRVVRFRPEKPDEREIIWTETPIEAQSFQLSQDGKRAAALIPAPLAARLNLEDHTFTKLAEGTWPSMAGDNSYATALLDTPKGLWQIFVPSEAEPSGIPLSTVGDMNGLMPWQPRWGNDPTFMAFSGHYPKAPDDPSFDPQRDGSAAEIYLCRMNASGTEFQSVSRITNDGFGDYFPDVYAFGFVPPFAGLPQSPKDLVEIKGQHWPAHTASACALWENMESNPTFSEPLRVSSFTPAKFAKFTRDLFLDLSQGQCTLDQASTNAWASGVAASGEFSLEGLFVESFSKQENLSVRLASLTGPDGAELIGLYRLDKTLVLRLSTDGSGGSIAYHLLDYIIRYDEPYHLILTAHENLLDIILNGKLAGQITLKSGGFTHWKAGGRFTLGDLEPFGSGYWFGSVGQFGLYSKALPEMDFKAHAESARIKIAKRRPTDILGTEATLLAPPPPPEAGKANVLVPLRFTVKKVVHGIYSQPEITAYFWSVLNGVPCPGLPQDVGVSYPLTLEPLSQHPELKAQFPTPKPARNLEFYSTIPPNLVLKF